MFVDQAVPFLRRTVEEQAAKSNREQPQSKECKCNAARQTFRREMNGQAAGQQADRVEDRCLKHFSRRWSRDAFAQIKEIGDDKYREDRRLGDDETGHRDFPARG